MKVLKLDCKKINEDLLLSLDNLLLENSLLGFSHNIDLDEKILIFQKNELNNLKSDFTFTDYIEPGKLIKKWLIDNSVISDVKDNSLFSMFELKMEETINTINSKDLNGLIYKVPDDDPKLKSVLQKISTIKRNKLF